MKTIEPIAELNSCVSSAGRSSRNDLCEKVDKMANNKPLKPGQPTPTSGQYGLRGPRGGITQQEITSVKGKPLPPTPKPRQVYVLVDPTK